MWCFAVDELPAPIEGTETIMVEWVERMTKKSCEMLTLGHDMAVIHTDRFLATVVMGTISQQQASQNSGMVVEILLIISGY